MADEKTQAGQLKVLLLESVAQTAVNNFVKAGWIVETHHRLTQEELKQKIPEFHAIGIRSKTLLTEEVLDAAKNLIVIGHFCIGTDQTNLVHACKKGIPVFNSPFANTRSVAELMIAEIIMLARQAGDRSREMHQNIWNKVSKKCYEVRGKTVGIVGYGHVGQQLSVIAEALGMTVIYYDVVPKLSIGNASPVETLEELLAVSDFVSLHVPSTNKTHEMIGEEQVKMMKPGSFLLNASRGPVVILEPVAEALNSGHLAGAAFDVYPQEPGSKTDSYKNALQGCRNTILTPHIGGSTEEAQFQIGLETSMKLLDFMKTGRTLGSVNFPVMNVDEPDAGTSRILHTHQNKPGVLKAVNECFADVNITTQSLATKNGVGYLMVETEKVPEGVIAKVSALDATINMRVLDF